MNHPTPPSPPTSSQERQRSAKPRKRPRIYLGGLPRVIPNLRDLSSLRLHIFNQTRTWWSLMDIVAKIRNWEETAKAYRECDFDHLRWESNNPSVSESQPTIHTSSSCLPHCLLCPGSFHPFYSYPMDILPTCPSLGPRRSLPPSLPSHPQNRPSYIPCAHCQSDYAPGLRPYASSREKRALHPEAMSRQAAGRQPHALTTNIFPDATGFDVKRLNMNTYNYYLTSSP
ncbi:hypothetical protein NMY22_g3257 [Coprinellus aureogranulatus]|nr:hypothetical protein NMY22_g3257 [Coprinellus aureogranulatus]